jgi:hypothetical protein
VRRAWALAVALVAACGSRGPGLDRERAAAVFSRVAVDTGGVHGLSGLAVDGDGRLWTVAERGAVAFAITVDGGVSTARRHPIAGLPPGEDLEAVAVADDGGLWLGTEGRDRGVARVFHAARAGDGFAIDRPAIELRAETVGVEVGANHGAEGVCAAAGRIYVAIETAGRDDDGRWAPVVAIDPASGAQVVRRLRLTSDAGKLSALECWRDGERVRGWAIERHFAVTRLLSLRARRRGRDRADGAGRPGAGPARQLEPRGPGPVARRPAGRRRRQPVPHDHRDPTNSWSFARRRDVRAALRTAGTRGSTARPRR